MNGIIILAAGASQRLGQPKQLLEIDQENLLSRMIRIAKSSKFDAISVVLGAHVELILPEIDTSGIQVILNPDWDSGMSSSLACGLKHSLRINPGLQSVLILLVDQPFVSKKLIDRFLTIFNEKKPLIVASHYNNVFGVPALFEKQLFPEILNQKGQAGARELIKAHENDLIIIDFPEGASDIDTPEDLENLII